MNGVLPSAAAIVCGKCLRRLPMNLLNSAAALPCPHCGKKNQAWAFPAYVRPREAGRAAAPILTGDEASCFHHPGKKAEQLCACCGRFLCALCDVEIAGKHLCPACVASTPAEMAPALIPRQFRAEDLAISLVTLPLVLAFFTMGIGGAIVVLTTPAIIALTFWAWQRPPKPLPAERWRLVVASLLATLQLAAAILIVISIIFDWWQ